MPALRETSKQIVRDRLKRTKFTDSAYKIEFDDGTDFVTITFLPNKSFKFVASHRIMSGYGTQEAPGEHIVGSQNFSRDSIEDCLDAIVPWTDRIEAEYRASNPLIDEFDALRKQLAQEIESHIGDESAHFSREEVAAIRKGLDDLSARLTEVKERTVNQEIQLKAAQQEIASLKQDLDSLPKGVWYRMANSKVIDIMKRAATSKEGREFMLEAAKKLLLPGPPQ